MTIARPLPPAKTNGTPHKPVNRLGRVDISKVPPDRDILNAVAGWGKTSYASFAPNPAILMARGETGYPTLLKAGLVPNVDAVELANWQEVLDQIDYMISEPTGHETLVLDALGGFERLCHEHVCERDFGGKWGKDGFQSYMQGYDVSVGDWLLLLQRLDRIRIVRNMKLVILSHVKVAPFKNPLGADFDRYTADCHPKTWAATEKWADNVFFGTFNTAVIDSSGKIATVADAKKGGRKGIGGDKRIVNTQRTPGYDAKNRHGMPQEIEMPDTPDEMWQTIAEYMTAKPQADDMPPV